MTSQPVTAIGSKSDVRQDGDMKVVVPWPVADQQSAPLPDEVELVSWIGGDPPAEALDAPFVMAPYAAGKPGRLAMFTDLQVLLTQSAGVDWVIPEVPDGVVLCDASGVHDRSTAEWVLTAILTSIREIPRFVRQQDAHVWQSKDTTELAGRRVLIVGYGSIGSAIERRLTGFEVEITRVARRGREGVHSIDELPDLLPYADVAVVIVPLTDQTRGLVDAKFLAGLPDGALMVNASRGPVVDDAALLAELHSGRITAAIDVTDEEPLPPENPLWQAPGLLLTPHIGGDTTNYRGRLHTLVRDQVARHLAGQPLVNIVENGY
jgi:phosphoglycerate dehydrogenase-like enzyme